MSSVDERPAPPAHRISREQLAELASGGGSPDTVRFLAATQLSRRKLLLYALQDLATIDLGPLPPVDDAWTIMEQARSKAAETFHSVIMFPQIGNWAAYAIREHPRKPGDDGAPAWVDFGQIHAVALVAATACGLAWRTRVPLRAGRVTLPGWGQAVFTTEEQWASADAETTGGEIRLTHGGATVAVPADPRQDGPGWQALRVLTAGDDPSIRVVLDDLDPLRNLADPVEPERLSDDETGQWRSALRQAWALLVHDDRETARALSLAVSSLAPLARADVTGDDEIRSASTAEAFGAVVLSTPVDPVDLAATLVHEFQHIKLGCLMHLCALHREDGQDDLYAPWRDDPRPIGGLVQGIYAFHGIAAFYRRRMASADGAQLRAAQYAYAVTRAQTLAGLAAARASDGLTDLGRDFLDGLDRTMGRWHDDDLPDLIRRLAGLTVTAHRTTWLLRYRRPEPGTVDAFVRTWSEGRPLPRAGLGTGRIESPAGPPPRTTTWIRPLRLAVHAPLPATSPETALAAGDPATAKAAFRAAVEADPDDITAWTGLALACAELGEAQAAAALTGWPDLIRAGYRALADRGAAPAPDLLAAWAGGPGQL